MSPLARLLRGDEKGGSDTSSFSQTVIPAKGEAREPGTMYPSVLIADMDPGSRSLLTQSPWPG